MLQEHWYAFGLLLWPNNLKKKFFKEGDPSPLTYFCPGSAPGRIWPKCLKTCKRPWVLHSYQVSSKSIEPYCSKGWLCVPIHIVITCISAPPPFLHQDIYIKKSLKLLKHFNLLYKHLPLENIEITQNKCWLNTTAKKAIEIALKHAKMTKSKKTSKTCQKFDFGMEPKIITLHPTFF